MYRVVIENKSEKPSAVSDAQLMLSEHIAPGGTVAFELETKEELDRMTPQLVQLDAMDGVEVDVKELG